MGMIFFAFVSCDLLSTINAVKGFYTEYTEFSEIYNDATQYSVLTETQLTISDTNIEEMLPLNSRVYFMMDTESEFLYVEQNLQGENRNRTIIESAFNVIKFKLEFDNSSFVTFYSL